MMNVKTIKLVSNKVAKAFLATLLLLTVNQGFAQTVNTATVTRPAGLTFSCVNGPVDPGVTYANGAPASCSRYKITAALRMAASTPISPQGK